MVLNQSGPVLCYNGYGPDWFTIKKVTGPRSSLHTVSQTADLPYSHLIGRVQMHLDESRNQKEVD